MTDLKSFQNALRKGISESKCFQSEEVCILHPEISIQIIPVICSRTQVCPWVFGILIIRCPVIVQVLIIGITIVISETYRLETKCS